MITYKKQGKNNIKVYLDNKRVGAIRIVPNGYSYFTYPDNYKGETFSSIEAVKKSIEAE